MANLKSSHENSTARIPLKRRILFLLLRIYVATAVMSKSPLLANKNTTGHLTLNRKQASPKKRCTYRLHGTKGCSAVLCSSCYSFLRPLHSKSRQHASGISPATDNLRAWDVHSATTSQTVQEDELISIGKKHDRLVEILAGQNKDNLACQEHIHRMKLVV